MRVSGRYIGGAVFAALVGLLLGVWLLVGTTAGSQWLLKRLLAQGAMPFSVSVVEGHLIDRLTLHDVQASWDGGSVEIDHVTLAWSPTSLPLRTLTIHALDFGTITLRMSAPADQAASPPAQLPWPTLPGWLEAWQVNIDQLQIALLQIEQPSTETLSVEALGAALSLQKGQLLVDNLRARYGKRNLVGNLQIGLSRPLLKASLELSDHADPVAEKLKLSLDLDASQDPYLLAGPLQLSARLPDWPEHRLSAHLDLAADQLELSGLRLAPAEGAGSLTGQLSLSWATAVPQATFDLNLLGWPLPAEAEPVVVIDGHLQGSASLAQHQGRFDLTSTGGAWRQSHLAGVWSGGQNNLQAEIQRGAWLGGDLHGTAALDWTDQFKARLKLGAQRLDPALLAADWSGVINLSTDVELLQTPTETQVKFAAGFVDSVLRGVPLRGEVAGRWQQESLTIDRLELRGDGFDIQGQGTLAERLSLKFTVDDLAGLIPQAAGRVHGHGWLGLRESGWLADFSAEADHLQVGGLSLAAAKLELSRPDLATPAALHLDASGIDLGTLRCESLQVKASGDFDKHTLEVGLVLPEGMAGATLSGQRTVHGWEGFLRDLHFEQGQLGSWAQVDPASLQLDAETLKIAPLRLRGRAGELAFAGSFGRDGRPRSLEVTAEQFPLDWSAAIVPDWRLHGTLDASLSCGASNCRLQASGIKGLQRAGHLLRFDALKIDGVWSEHGLNARLLLGLDEAGELSARIESKAPWRWQLPEDGQLSLTLRKLAPQALLGLFSDLPVTGSLSGELSAAWRDLRPELLSVALSGPFAWQGSPKPLAMQLALNGDWNSVGLNLELQAALAGGGQIVLHADNPTLPNWSLLRSLDWSADWSEIPLARYYSPAPGVVAQGVWQGHAEGDFNDDLLFSSSGHSEILHGSLSWQDDDAGEIVVKLNEAVADWRWQKDLLKARLAIDLDDKGSLSAHVGLPLASRLPLAPIAEGQLSGQLTAEVEESGLLGRLLPEFIQDTGGKVHVDADLAGSWQAPVLTGTAALDGGRGYQPDAGIRLEKISLLARFDSDHVDITSLTLASGQGQLSGQGSFSLKGWRPAAMTMTLAGENFTLIDLPELQVQISPQLSLSGTPEAPTLAGEIRIPHFLATARSTRSPVSVSPDVVIVDALSKEPAPLPLKLSSRVRLLLGDAVLVKMFGLDARLGGQLELTGLDARHFSGRGELYVEEGAYATYGVKLKIDKGRAVYAGGPLDNPAIDILALKKSGDVSVGVQIRGTARAPEAKLYSEPAMADTDILSYIVLGRPISQAGGETDPLMVAAGALLSAGDSAVLRSRLQSQFGIDTLEAGSDSGHPSDTVLRLGKYLTPDLYLSYGYSLFNRQNEVGLRYRFLERWEAESKLGLESGADLHYRFEFD